MEHFASVTTTKTKVSLLHTSTFISQRKSSVVVFMNHQLKRLHISLPSEGITIQELIEKSLEKFSQLCGKVLNSKISKWELYASKKNFKVYSDFPSLDPSISVQKTGFQHFYLCKQFQLSECSSSSSSKIKTSFQEEKPKKEIKVQQTRSCLCFTF